MMHLSLTMVSHTDKIVPNQLEKILVPILSSSQHWVSKSWKELMNQS